MCGLCDSNERCTGGSCVVDPNLCNPVANTGCAQPNQCFLLSSEDTVCIVPGSGAVSTVESRLNPAYGRVTELRSDLASLSRQYVIGINFTRATPPIRPSSVLFGEILGVMRREPNRRPAA